MGTTRTLRAVSPRYPNDTTLAQAREWLMRLDVETVGIDFVRRSTGELLPDDTPMAALRKLGDDVEVKIHRSDLR